jgi:O-antigen/teichoic acid export membrane protein
MIRSFLRSSAFYFAANAIGKAATFAFWAYLARILSLEEMGRWALLNVAITLISFFMTLDLPSGFARFYSEFADPAKRREFEASYLNFLALLNLALAAGLFLARPWVEKAAFPMATPLYLLLLAMPLLTALNGSYLYKLRLEDKVTKVLALSLIQPAVSIATSLLCLRSGMDKILAVTLGMAAQYLSALPFFFLDLRGYRIVMDKAALRPAVLFSVYLFPSSLGAYLSLLAGKYLLGKLADAASLGMLEANSKISLIVGLFMDPLYLATSPLIYRHYNQAGFRRKYFQLIGINAFALLLLTLPIVLFSRDLVRILVGEKYVSHAFLILPLSIVAGLAYLSKFLALNEHLAKKTQYDVVPELTAGLINVVLGFILIRRYGINGSVAAMTITYSIRFCIYCVFAKWFLPSLFVGYARIAAYLLGLGAILGFNLLLSGTAFWIRGAVLCLEIATLGWYAIKLAGLGSFGLIFRPRRLWALAFPAEGGSDA